MAKDEALTDAPAVAVLELLAQESPPGHFQELLQRGRRQKLPPEQLAELERATQLAMGIHASANQRRQREAVMAALVDTVHDMTAPYDPDTLLKVITSRARRLLGFDMAYISLRKSEGGSYIHSSDGDTTALNVGLVVQESHGLGEMAQDKGAPFWTSDYLNDDRIPHREEVDEVVRAEGLHAIMAVPIFQGSAPTGALYGADRVVRHFTPDEISVMRSLADFASVALEKARLLDRTQTEIAELESEGFKARGSIARMAYLNEVQSRLIAQVLDGGDLQDIVRTAADALGATLAVGDPQGQILASTGSDAQGEGFAEAEDFKEALTGRAALEARAAGSPSALSENLWATPVAAGAEDLGVVLLKAAQPPAPEAERFFGFVGQIVALLLVIQRSTAVAAGPVRDELFDDLLAAPLRAPRQLTHRAWQSGIDPDGSYVVVLARPEGGEHGKAVVWASSYAYRHSGLKTVQGGCIVLLLPGSDASAAARAVSDELSPLLGRPVTVGASGPADGLAAVAKVYQESLRCLDALIALDGVGSAASMSDLGFLGLLLSNDHDVDGFVSSAIGPVLDHDARRTTALVPTIEAYFTSGNSPTRAAEDLHVHPNTVARRLDRITDLLGPGWQKPARALEVQLALRLLRARDVLRRQRESDPQAGIPGT
ncbi:helix-turn-helix domain-containing protein [Streptomyces sp. ISL-100]|uniref:helix-turn-helix domain-containing protein n=1 Tax=Streptomyces sp. ISL-100 TaxID=2819173 RepID=UPI001BE91789|nr:helix-turn-helix domain-containing protein [Streptomyces sp. ISL-100]MBT2397433.1 helix-turn-helix domain-containing protein [Streptomyces sp. ISL-100]